MAFARALTRRELWEEGVSISKTQGPFKRPEPKWEELTINPPSQLLIGTDHDEPLMDPLQYALQLKMALAEKNPLLQQELIDDLQIPILERNMAAAAEALNKWEEGVSISKIPDHDEVIDKEGFTRRIINNFQLAETSITEKVALITDPMQDESVFPLTPKMKAMFMAQPEFQNNPQRLRPTKYRCMKCRKEFVGEKLARAFRHVRSHFKITQQEIVEGTPKLYTHYLQYWIDGEWRNEE